ncbi:outer membrane lipoprotein carrier protein LolA [Leifsonia kafniensis]|uniref:Outer membrane lipoprotein carrier protein LolA n=1 Tax=Leifsonia kafniensis TaxID=475957 RepID=A0ABP7K237_9MICO
MTRSWLRWLPALVVPAVIGAGIVIVPLMANATVSLPDKTPEQVLELVGENSVTAFSGTVEQSSQLGLPELPKGMASEASELGAGGVEANAASLIELLSGSHTARVYLDGAAKARVQVLDQLAERDAIRNGSDVWLYDSAQQTATHLTLPAQPSTGDAEGSVPTPGEVLTPAQVAERLLAAVDPSTTVSVGAPVKVAGRTAYDLVLTPNSANTLVGSVSVAVDSVTGMPLKVAVQARGQHQPAFEIAFSELTVQAPAAELFNFTPPPGATVKNVTVPAFQKGSTSAEGIPQHTVTGSGWESILTATVGVLPASVTASPLFNALTQSVPGGRAISTSLVTALLTDDGRLFVGAVPLSQLQAAAATQ